MHFCFFLYRSKVIIIDMSDRRGNFSLLIQNTSAARLCRMSGDGGLYIQFLKHLESIFIADPLAFEELESIRNTFGTGVLHVDVFCTLAVDTNDLVLFQGIDQMEKDGTVRDHSYQ